MSQNTEVTASDVIDYIRNHLKAVSDIKHEGTTDEAMTRYNNMVAEKDIRKTRARLEDALNLYVDQRIMHILDKAGICKIVNPLD